MIPTGLDTRQATASLAQGLTGALHLCASAFILGSDNFGRPNSTYLCQGGVRGQERRLDPSSRSSRRRWPAFVPGKLVPSIVPAIPN
jgi:hypothetical protein